MTVSNKLTVIHDGSGAELSISGFSGTLIATSISGGGLKYSMIDLDNLDAVALTQQLAAKVPTMEPVTITCDNQGGTHRSGLAGVTGIRTFAITSPLAKDGTSKYVFTFCGEITGLGDHSFKKGDKSEFDIEISPTGITATGTADTPVYS